MDRQMPIMDRLTATRKIRVWEQANDRPLTPIVALTASALKSDRETCLAAGCTAFLTKPIKQEVLLQAINGSDRGREGCRLPSLRTVLAVFPHTALQLLVSTSGMSRSVSNHGSCEQ
jgi:CheY-like chemotaxis protein